MCGFFFLHSYVSAAISRIPAATAVEGKVSKIYYLEISLLMDPVSDVMAEFPLMKEVCLTKRLCV